MKNEAEWFRVLHPIGMSWDRFKEPFERKLIRDIQADALRWAADLEDGTLISARAAMRMEADRLEGKA